ncbi:hypothetical protein MHC_04000 [Mycoplasma haemocanis str. Illinois]|uniref:Uncharacterized protein n=1 Tax=Mycoplasma haemocanis (strain Illinois) TaxID=1111676 RepID=H6N7N6_MYCHN|nr:hypothetical protein [Mycoplasma haemocanis]AEW45658.1 hypothetical protein MHC_04000 [Mycoplasma haemocanis str. Illinois]
MSKTLFLSLGTLGAGGVGLGVVGIHYWNKTPEAAKVAFREKYGKALLDTNSDDGIWTTKLNFLATSSSNPKNSHLVRAKAEKNGGKENEAKASLKRGCEEIYSKSIDGEDDFHDFRSFCSFNNGDKIPGGKTLVGADTDLSSHWNTFNSSSRENLYKGFREIFDARGNDANANNWKTKMFEKCKGIASDIFEGSISNFDTFCTKAGTVGGVGA